MSKDDKRCGLYWIMILLCILIRIYIYIYIYILFHRKTICFELVPCSATNCVRTSPMQCFQVKLERTWKAKALRLGTQRCRALGGFEIPVPGVAGWLVEKLHDATGMFICTLYM